MFLAFAVESLDDIVRVTFRGDLDISRAHEVGQALHDAAQTDTRPVLIVLDASVRFLDSITLSELLLFRRRLLSSSRRVAMYVADANIYRLLTIADVVERFNATMIEEDALRALRA